MKIQRGSVSLNEFPRGSMVCTSLPMLATTPDRENPTLVRLDDVVCIFGCEEGFKIPANARQST